MQVIKRPHWLLVTLVLVNAAATEVSTCLAVTAEQRNYVDNICCAGPAVILRPACKSSHSSIGQCCCGADLLVL